MASENQYTHKYNDDWIKEYTWTLSEAALGQQADWAAVHNAGCTSGAQEYEAVGLGAKSVCSTCHVLPGPGFRLQVWQWGTWNAGSPLLASVQLDSWAGWAAARFVTASKQIELDPVSNPDPTVQCWGGGGAAGELSGIWFPAELQVLNDPDRWLCFL